MMAVAGSMNGLIAYGIQIHLNHLNGWLAWRWLFLIEGKKKKITKQRRLYKANCLSPFLGVISVGSGFIVMLLLPPVPERIRWFFTEEEKQIAVRRSKQAFNTPDTGFKLGQLKAVLRDRKIWFYCKK